MIRPLFVDHAGVLGGAELSLLDVAEDYSGAGAVCLLADGPFRGALERRGVAVAVDPLGAFGSVRKASVLPNPAALFDALGAASRLARRAASFDLIYANSQKAFVVSALAGRRADRPVVWHLRDILSPPHFSRVAIRVAVSLANRYAAAVIANSQATGRAFVEAGGRASLVHVVSNGIDPAPFDAVTPGASTAVREDLGPPATVPLVVHVGRFHHWKGQQVLLRALARAPQVHAWIVGAPLFGEEAFAAELRRLSNDLQVAGRVQFLGFRDDIPTLLKAGDIVVHSSVYPEPFGRVIVEGMLAGKPVVAADAGGVREIIGDGDTGVLVRPDDPDALAAAITRCVDAPAATAAMAARGETRARDHFSRSAMLRGVRAVLESVTRG